MSVCMNIYNTPYYKCWTVTDSENMMAGLRGTEWLFFLFFSCLISSQFHTSCIPNVKSGTECLNCLKDFMVFCAWWTQTKSVCMKKGMLPKEFPMNLCKENILIKALFTSGFHILLVSHYMRKYAVSALTCQNQELHALLQISKFLPPPLKPSLHPGIQTVKSCFRGSFS